MRLYCFFGKHEWNGCKCLHCNNVIDENHDFDGCICKRCGKTRDQNHDFNDGCKCIKCDKTRNESHAWSAWSLKGVNFYYCDNYRVGAESYRSCTDCGITDICRSHVFKYDHSTGSLYDNTQYYRCSKCGFEHSIDYNI